MPRWTSDTWSTFQGRAITVDFLEVEKGGFLRQPANFMSIRSVVPVIGWGGRAKRIRPYPSIRRVVFNRNFSVAVVVSNGKRSAKWYTEKLGFESSVQGHWITVWPKGADWRIHLCQQPKSKLESGNTGISFYAKDVEGTVKELKTRGVKFETDFTKSEWGSLAMLKDPDGNDIWINEDAP